MEKELKAYWDAKRWDGKLLYFPVVDSTNTKARQLAFEGYPSGTLIVAEQQEAGRGRNGRTWMSPKGDGIFMTLLLRPEIAPANASMITLVAAMATTAAIEKKMGCQAKIKWPNDIVISGKKVCGILTEMSMEKDAIHHIAVGIGMNVYDEAFPKEIESVATSLYLETGQKISRAELIVEILERFEYYYAIYHQTEDMSGLLSEYNLRLVNLGQMVKVMEGKAPFEGRAGGITSRGELIVDTAEGRKLVSSGEVSVRGIYGYV